MALSPEEQQELDEFRIWWKENSLWILLGAVLVFGGAGGYKGWDVWQATRAQEAAALYQQYHDHMGAGEQDQVNEKLELLMADYSETPYSLLAGLISARIRLESGKIEESMRLLRWVRDHADDEHIAPLAAMRLARLHVLKQQWEEGLEVLESVPLEGFEPLAHAIRGDLYRGAGRAEDAREEYTRALEKGDYRGGFKDLLELKLTDLGERYEDS